MHALTRPVVSIGLMLGLLGATGSAAAQTSPQQACLQASDQQLVIYHAGSLTAAFTPVEKAFTCQTGIQVQDHTGGSLDLMRQVTAGDKTADIVASADYVDIDQFLKPADAASYDIVFAHGRMVLAYSASDVGPSGKNLPPLVDPAAAPFSPPASVPTVADDWYKTLLTPGVTVGGSHPFMDPSGYRAHLMFQLAQAHAGVPNLYNDLLEHYFAIPATAPANANGFGKQYDFQLIYEHSALAAARTNPDYRYAYLPDDVDLSNPDKNDVYRLASIAVPGLGVPGAEDTVTIPATPVAWGLTVMNAAPNRENAIKFLQLLLLPDGVGQASLSTVGPAPVSPPIVSRDDWAQLPTELQTLVASGDPRAT